MYQITTYWIIGNGYYNYLYSKVITVVLTTTILPPYTYLEHHFPLEFWEIGQITGGN